MQRSSSRFLSGRVARRSFLAGMGAVAGITLARQLPLSPFAARAQISADPFTLGVASGDPLPDGVVIWTRLAPDPLNGSGVGRRDVIVDWQVATDESMRTVVQRGTALASPLLGHAVHVDVRGLDPGRTYWYQFRAGDALSPVGRTRTAPALGAALDRLRFAFVSCQHYEQGFYTAYRHLAADDLDLVVHLGDYIYEGAPVADRPRSHNGPEPVTLADYRNRYALYKSDPDLRAAHAAVPFIVTWDDHEVDNNYAGSIDQDGSATEPFLARRANAYQAYYEHMPLRAATLPNGPDMQLYRRLTYGDLAEFSVLDTRQYRTDQPCGDGNRVNCDERLDESRTMTGPEQEAWLLDGLAASRARWNVIAQQVMMGRLDVRAGPEQELPMDHWNGYAAQRARILGFLEQQRITNPVVITGDIHSNWVNDLKPSFDDERSPVVATEFVGTSISSAGDGVDTRPEVVTYQWENPHIRFYNGQRGYTRCTLTPTHWQTDFLVLQAVTTPGLPIGTRASFVVESGRAGAVQT